MDKINKLSVSPLILIAVCAICRPAKAETSIYVFNTSQSTVTQTGGFAGVHETYTITGQYRLSVDSDTGVALFKTVDANLADQAGVLYSQSLNEIFNMTGLAGIVVNKRTLEFKGKTADGTESDVLLNVSFSDNMAHLVGNTTPPPNSADMFIYDVNAVALRKYAGGAGEPNNPYQIATFEDLMLLGDSPEDYDKHFIMTTDIDLDPNLPNRKVFDKAVIAPHLNPDNSWQPYEGTYFTGVIDGNGRIISHLTIEGYIYLGLFGGLAPGAIISNLGLEEVDVNGTSDFIGSLVGINEGYITQSYSTGTVIGDDDVGGLVGNNLGSITNSYSSNTVSGNDRVGGLTGQNEGSITSSYSIGLVIEHKGDRPFGGLVGENSGNITKSFWDLETSDQVYSAGGEGKTTAEMQTASTFLEAGWDFVGETDNGTEDIWSICEKTNYPRFVWQIPPGDFVCPDGVAIEDFSFLMEHWLDVNCDSSNGYCEGTDLDQSGSVDATDLEIFFENWPDKN